MSPEQAKGASRCPHRPLQPGQRALPDGDPQTPLRRSQHSRGLCRLVDERAAPSHQPQPRDARRSRSDRHRLPAKDRDQRYRSAEEMSPISKLSPFASQPAMLRPPAFIFHTGVAAAVLPLPPASGRRLRSRMIVIGALLLVAFAGGISLFRHHPVLSPPHRGGKRHHHRRRLRQQDGRPGL